MQTHAYTPKILHYGRAKFGDVACFFDRKRKKFSIRISGLQDFRRTMPPSVPIVKPLATPKAGAPSKASHRSSVPPVVKPLVALSGGAPSKASHRGASPSARQAPTSSRRGKSPRGKSPRASASPAPMSVSHRGKVKKKSGTKASKAKAGEIEADQTPAAADLGIVEEEEVISTEPVVAVESSPETIAPAAGRRLSVPERMQVEDRTHAAMVMQKVQRGKSTRIRLGVPELSIPQPDSAASAASAAAKPVRTESGVPKLSIPERMLLEDQNHAALILQKVHRGNAARATMKRQVIEPPQLASRGGPVVPAPASRDAPTVSADGVATGEAPEDSVGGQGKPPVETASAHVVASAPPPADAPADAAEGAPSSSLLAPMTLLTGFAGISSSRPAPAAAPAAIPVAAPAAAPAAAPVHALAGKMDVDALLSLGK